MADAVIQLLRRPETLAQLCDITTDSFDGPLGHDYRLIAEAAATKGRGVSPELWAAKMWAITRFGIPADRIKALALIVSEVRAIVCIDYYCPTKCQVQIPEWELLKIAYMVCPKESPVFPIILYSLARRISRWWTWAPVKPAMTIQASPGGETTTLIYGDLLAAVLSHPTATARLRAFAICDQSRKIGFPSSVDLLYQAYETDPTYVTVYALLANYIDSSGPAYAIRLGAQMLNRWGLALKASTNIVGRKSYIYFMMEGCIPELNGTVISLGDSSMSVFDYICALETPEGSFFRPEMLTDMLPVDTPWSCRRHEALDRRTDANALFATLLCALARLESPGGPLHPSHQTMWEDALESWTLGDSAVMWAPPSPGDHEF